jgi:hypothetical protein
VCLVDFSIIYVKHEVNFISSFNLTIDNNVSATKIIRRNTMHKNTRSILGNPSQQGKKSQPNPLLYSSIEIPSPPRNTYHTRGCSKPRILAPKRGVHLFPSRCTC